MNTETDRSKIETLASYAEALLFAEGGSVSRKKLASQLGCKEKELSDAFAALSERLAGSAISLITTETEASLVVAPVLALEDVIRSLKQRLTGALRAQFSELTKSQGKHEVIVYFLATLELVRSGSISVTQERLFSDMTLEAETAGIPRYG